MKKQEEGRRGQNGGMEKKKKLRSMNKKKKIWEITNIRQSTVKKRQNEKKILSLDIKISKIKLTRKVRKY